MSTITYKEQLKDPRWQRLRLQILDAANWGCEDCGRRDLELHVHHCAYMPRRAAFEHKHDLLMALCYECHERRQRLEDTFRIELGRITRHLPAAQLEAETWRIIKDVATRETERLAEAFTA
jgi:hypothetical protein